MCFLTLCLKLIILLTVPSCLHGDVNPYSFNRIITTDTCTKEQLLLIAIHSSVQVRYRYIVQLHRTGIYYRYIIHVCRTGISYGYTVQVYHTGIPYRYILQVYRTGVLHRRIIQVYCWWFTQHQSRTDKLCMALWFLLLTSYLGLMIDHTLWPCHSCHWHFYHLTVAWRDKDMAVVYVKVF